MITLCGQRFIGALCIRSLVWLAFAKRTQTRRWRHANFAFQRSGTFTCREPGVSARLRAANEMPEIRKRIRMLERARTLARPAKREGNIHSVSIMGSNKGIDRFSMHSQAETLHSKQSAH